MTAKEKAEELIIKYSRFVNGYVGSSMLTNTEYPETIKENAKQCALIVADEITKIKLIWFQDNTIELDFWQEVKQEIEKL